MPTSLSWIALVGAIGLIAGCATTPLPPASPASRPATTAAATSEPATAPAPLPATTATDTTPLVAITVTPKTEPLAAPPATVTTAPASPLSETMATPPAEVAVEIDVWERIRRGFAMPELNNKAAANSTRWYAAQTDYISRMASRATPYLFHIVEEVEKRGMPTELALLPFVESAMQPEAQSHAKAVGLWQFIPSTGRLYELEQNAWHDQRRDVIESTRAALDYLQKLYDEFGDWHLALAAYNCGEGCVGRAVARNQARKKSTKYEQLRLPRETLGYVPKLQAIKNIVREPTRYDLTLPAIENKPYFVAVAKTRDIDVATAARLAEMSPEEFRALNPAFNRPVIVGATKLSLLLPAEREQTFLANLAAWEATDQPLASWTTYTMSGTETLTKVAQRVGVSEAALREANQIPPRYQVRAGSTILIPRDESMEDDIDPDHIQAAFAYVPERSNVRRITYRVRRGDTLTSIARRWKVKTRDIVAWNSLRSEKLFAGQRLNLTVSGSSRKAKKAKARTKAPVVAKSNRRTTPSSAVVSSSATRAAAR